MREVMDIAECAHDVHTRICTYDWSTSELFAKHGPQAAVKLALDSSMNDLTVNDWNQMIVRLCAAAKLSAYDKDALLAWAANATLDQIKDTFKHVAEGTYLRD